MQVTILGSGTAVPVSGRFPSGVLVEAEDQRILVDIGPGTLRRLAETGIGLEQITCVLLTHYHTDHTADVAALLFALRNPGYAGRPPLQIKGAAGLDEFLGHLTAAWPWLQPKTNEYELQTEAIGPGRFHLGEVQVLAVPIRHTAQSLAYRLTDSAGRSVALSGDADVCDGLAEVARDTDLFICDAAFPGAQRTEGHLTPGLAGEWAQKAGTRKLCLTHFYPECDGHDLLAEARKTFTGEIVLAKDLMQFDLTRTA
jgi:ribonuclease BN (tRNA processing enzyme)